MDLFMAMKAIRVVTKLTKKIIHVRVYACDNSKDILTMVILAEFIAINADMVDYIILS